MIPLLLLALPAPALQTEAFPEFASLRTAIPVEVAGAGWATPIDLFGDGVPHMVLSVGGDLQFLRNDGSGFFSPLDGGGFPFAPGLSARHLVAADLNGDGLEDLILDETFLFNEGGGRFSPPIQPLGAFQVDGIALLDIDGDRDLDVVLDFNPLQLLRNDGAGTFEDVTSSLPSIRVNGVAAADFDLDGDVDMAVGLRNGTNVKDVVFLENDGSGTFSRNDDFVPPVACSGMLEGRDLDQDGDADLLVATCEELVYFRNDGGALVRDLSFPDVDVDCFAVDDLDGDSDPDVLSLQPLAVLRNDGGGVFVNDPSGFPQSRETRGVPVRLLDLDGDADADVFALGRAPRILYGDGQGSFLESNRYVIPEELTPFELADLDGDGDADVVGRNRGELEIRWNNGAGALERRAESFPLPGVIVQGGAAVGDLDGDGHEDIWVATVQDRLLMQRNGSFEDETTARLPQETSSTIEAVLADLDGDGDLDGIQANRLSNRWFRNDGVGFFSAEPSFAGNGYTLAVAVGDVNADGFLDVFFGNEGPNQLLLADGTGGFTDVSSTNLPFAAVDTHDVLVVDLDSDGDLDVYTANQRFSSIPEPNVFLQNDGKGRFEAAGSYGNDPTSRVVTWDLDADGDQDLISQGFELSLLRNDGTGNLEPMGETIPTFADRLVVGDLDGDEDPDLLLETRVFTNVSRALALRGRWRSGRGLALELFGDSREPYFLFAATESARVPTDLGLLGLSPADLFLFRSGSLGALGRGQVAIPSVHGLPAGTKLFWQGLLLGQGRLTNAEPTTAVDF